MQTSIIKREGFSAAPIQSSHPDQFVRGCCTNKAWCISVSVLLLFCCAFAVEGRVLGQVVQIYKTGVANGCPNSEIAVASLSVQLVDQNKTEARALCLILAPKDGKASGQMFCLYRFNLNDPVFYRDNDSRGLAELRAYSPDAFSENLTKFFDSLGCDNDNSLLERFSRAIKGIISEHTDLSALGVINRIQGLQGIEVMIDRTVSLSNAANQQGFPEVVHSYFSHPLTTSTPIPGLSPTPTQTPVGVDQLRADLEHERWRADFWFLIFGLVVLALVGTGVMIFLLRRKVVKQSLDKEEVRTEILYGLISKLHNNRQLSSPAQGINDILNEFQQKAQLLRQELTLGFQDENTIRKRFVEDVKDYCKSQEADKSEDRQPKDIAEQYFAHYSQLLQHKVKIEGEYSALYLGLNNKILEFLATTPFSNQKRTETDQGRSSDQNTRLKKEQADNTLSNTTERYARELDNRLSTLTGRKDSDSVLNVLGNLDSRLRRIWDDYGDQSVNYSVSNTLDLCNSRLRTSQSSTQEINEIRSTLSQADLLDGRESLSVVIRRIVEDHKKALKLLPDYKAASITGKLELVSNKLSMASNDIKEKFRGVGGHIDVLVKHVLDELQATKMDAETARNDCQLALDMVAGLEKERNDYKDRVEQAEPEAKAGLELVLQASVSLGFDVPKIPSSSSPVMDFIEIMKSEPPEHLEFRYRLLAVRSTLGLFKHSDEAQEKVAKLIGLASWQKSLELLLNELQTFTISELWQKGLSPGFSNDWLHDTLRASLLLDTYFSENQELFFLRDAAWQASRAIVSALRKLGVEVGEVKMFEPPQKEMEREKTKRLPVKDYPEIEEKVRQKFYENDRRGGFVVDVLNFPFRTSDGSHGGGGNGTVIILSPGDLE